MVALGVCLSQVAQAEQPLAAAKPTDIAMQDGGVLVGQVVNPDGSPVAGVPVSFRQNDKDWVGPKTGPDGVFAVKGLRGGVYQVAAAEGRRTCRVWALGTAPPKAQQQVVLVQGIGNPCEPERPILGFVRAHPLLTTAVVATAVAVPVAIAASDDEPEPPASP
jgi:hypothetical protein